ncbi:nuclear transport factor 2 family protein [Streptomyces ferrugineus]|uniref:Nuclear transport factor 2 family protein n=1 Tax=Streptomyces ferrugineus TaxID=1413221 RepID=A0A7M2SEM9_9ACTN|nr:nuclear transport factor 2 family protein [Streptomyces ferrugineus]QOV34787.1 nuclear transport factor 2 family protein [Streptomyces ferrugineus]
MTEHEPAVKAAIEGELRLLDPEVRRSPELLGSLLHPEFHEFGASGRRWDKASTVNRLHLTFDTVYNGRHAHRSSLWRRTDDGWQMYFHQGTPFTPEGE